MEQREFDQLSRPVMPRLRRLARRMIGNPDDAEDALQESLLRAYKGRDDFRGDAEFSTWLFTIVTRQCLNALRSQPRWRADAQVDLPRRFSEDVHESQDSPVHNPDFTFDAHEHIAFCFTCVARSLPPQQEAALILRDVFEFTNDEAAKMLELSHSAFRHELARARAHMQASFEGLCAIVNKKGVCYQCSGLRNRMPRGRQGPEVPTLGASGEPIEDRYRHRLRVVRDADLENGRAAGLHDLLFRRLSELEAGGR